MQLNFYVLFELLYPYYNIKNGLSTLFTQNIFLFWVDLPFLLCYIVITESEVILLEMHERIKELRKNCKLTQEAFGNRLSITRDMVNNIERGRVEIKDHIVKLICSEFSVNEDWLRYGDGDMKIKTPADTMEQLKKEFNLDEFDFNLVYEYLKLGGEQRKAVRDFFYRVIEAEENVDYISEAPGTPEELEENFPPVEGVDDSKTG